MTAGAQADERIGHDVSHGAALARGAFFNALGFLASNLRGIFTFLVARLLGSAVLGTFGIAWAITDLASKISTFGFETTAVTFVARAEGVGDRPAAVHVMRTALRLALLAGLAMGVAGFLLFDWAGVSFGARPELPRALGIVLLALPGVGLYRISNAVSRGMAVMHHDIYSRGFTESFGTAAALLIAYALGARALAPELAVVAGTLASGCVAYVFARRLFSGVDEAQARTFNRRVLLRDSAAVAAYDFLNIGIMQIDVIMLGLFVGRTPGVTLATVGIYAVAVEVAGGLRKVNQAFSPIFTTVIARQMAWRNIRDAEATFGVLGRWMLAVLLPAVVTMSLAGRAIMAIYGPAFAIGTSWLTIVSIACALNAFVGLGEVILMVERPQANLLNAVIAIAITIALNLVLIPSFGPLGAAIGMLVPYTIYGVLRAIEIRWSFDWHWPWRALIKPTVAALVPLAPALALRAMGSSILLSLATAGLYLAGYVIMWRLIGFEASDRAVLAHFFPRWFGTPGGVRDWGLGTRD